MEFDDNVSVSSAISGISAASGFQSQAGTASAAGEAASVYDYEEDYDDEEKEQKDIPEHACVYCHISDPACVLKCVETGKWFCNGRGNTNAAHIVQHLVMSGKKSVSLHPLGPLGDTILECYACGGKNVFTLGCVPALTTQIMALLCRECSPNNGSLTDLDWDPSQWKPIIQDKAFVDWLAAVPKEKVQLKADIINFSQISKLEKAWREDPTATLAAIEKVELKSGELDQSMHVRLDYVDGYHYQNVMAPLVMLEAEENRRLKEVVHFENVDIEWDKVLGKQTARFFLKGECMREDNDSRLVVGDELCFKLDYSAFDIRGVRVDAKVLKQLKVTTEGWSCQGTVVNLYDGEVSVEMSSKRVPDMITSGYTVSFVWKGVTYDRMQNALKTIAVDDTSVSGYLYHLLMGHSVGEEQLIKANLPEKAEDLRVPLQVYDTFVTRELDPKTGTEESVTHRVPRKIWTEKPNESQEKAIRYALTHPLSLIQGPPGTGKTFTSTCIVWHLAQQMQGQILVCAPSNVAVDHLTEKIAKTGLRVVRIAAKSRELEEDLAVSPEVLAVTLHHIVSTIYETTKDKQYEKLAQLQKLKHDQNGLSAKDALLYQAAKKQAEKNMLATAEVICCTCAGAGDPRIAKLRFRQVLIDESTQAMEPECLIPIVHGAKQVVLVGDHCQLGPILLSKEASKAGLSQSLFERLILLDHRPIRLTVQYRMHPALSEWPSNVFYEGTLQNARAETDCVNEAVEVPFDNQIPLLFHVSSGTEELAANGTTYINQKEAEVVERFVTGLMKGKALPEEIGIITPYEGQRAFITNFLTRNGQMNKQLYEKIEVASVDAFQGREKDFIILSCVRSNTNQGIGFLRDPRRLNVALTRARYGVFVIGNPNVLGKDEMWHSLLSHIQQRGRILEGASLASMYQSHIVLPPARINTNARNKVARCTNIAGPTVAYDGRERWDPQAARQERIEAMQRGWGATVQEHQVHDMRLQAQNDFANAKIRSQSKPKIEVALNKKDSRYDKHYDDAASTVSSEVSYRTQNRSLQYGADDASESGMSFSTDLTM